MTDELSLGIPLLERRIGAVPPGHLLAVSAPPGTQGHLLLRALATPRETHYLSTARSASEVRRGLGPKSTRVVHIPPEELLEEPAEYIAPLGERSTLIIETMNELEHSRERYRTFLTAVRQRLEETDSLGVLYCVGGDDQTPLRWLTLARADMVWKLRQFEGTLAVETRLYITKDSHGEVLLEPVKLQLTDGVYVDTSRDIA